MYCSMGALAKDSPKSPKECKLIKDGCDYVMVRKSDETKDCKTGKSIVINQSPYNPFIIDPATNSNFEQWRNLMPELWNVVSRSGLSTKNLGDESTLLMNGASLPGLSSQVMRVSSSNPIFDANSLTNNGFSSTSTVRGGVPMHGASGANNMALNTMFSSSSNGMPFMIGPNSPPIGFDTNGMTMNGFSKSSEIGTPMISRNPGVNVQGANTTKIFSHSTLGSPVFRAAPSNSISWTKRIFTDNVSPINRHSLSSFDSPLMVAPPSIPDFDTNNVASYKFSTNTAVGTPMMTARQLNPAFDTNSMVMNRVFKASQVGSPLIRTATNYPVSDGNRISRVMRMESTNPVFDANSLAKNINFLHSAAGQPVFNPAPMASNMISEVKRINTNGASSHFLDGTPVSRPANNPVYDGQDMDTNILVSNSAIETPIMRVESSKPFLDANRIIKNVQSSHVGVPIVRAAPNHALSGTHGSHSMFSVGTPLVRSLPKVSPVSIPVGYIDRRFTYPETVDSHDTMQNYLLHKTMSN